MQDGTNLAIRHLYISVQSFMRGPSILKSNVTLSKKILFGCNAPRLVSSNDQFGDSLTKSFRGSCITYICNKFAAYNIYAPTREGGVGINV